MASNVTLPIGEIPLTNISLSQFSLSQLYCLSPSSTHNPLQNPLLYPHCYGICPNQAISGIGTRTAAYAQALLALWVVVFCYNIGDIRMPLFSNALQPLSLVISSFFSYQERALDLHHATLLLNLISLPTVAFSFALVRLKFREEAVPVGVREFGVFGLLIQLVGIALFGIIARRSFTESGYTTGSGSWYLAQPACFSDTAIVLFARSYWIYPSQAKGRTVGIVLFAILHSLPFLLGIVMYTLFFTERGRRHDLALRNGENASFNKKHTSFGELMYTIVTTSLGTLYILIGIVDTEVQLRTNTVLSGEDTWTQGQVITVAIVLVPFCNLVMIGYKSVRKTDHGAPRPTLDRVFGIEQRHQSTGGVSYELVRPHVP